MKPLVQSEVKTTTYKDSLSFQALLQGQTGKKSYFGSGIGGVTEAPSGRLVTAMQN